MRRLLALLFVALPLAACASSEPGPTLPTLTFANLKPLHIDASKLEIKNDFQPPLGYPHVESSAPIAPADALNTWATQRLQPTGDSPGTLRFTILDGSLTEQKLKTKGGIVGAFENQQAFKYKAVAEARVELLGAPGTTRVVSTARAERTTTVAEDATLNQRDQALFDLVEKLMKDFNQQMEASIRQYFSGHMR